MIGLSPAPLADVPFELRGVHIYIQATINGQGPFPMNVDTGSYLGLTAPLAGQLGLKPEKAMLQGGAGAGLVQSGWGKIGTVGIGSVQIKNLEGMFGTDQSAKEAGIGQELFQRFTVELDNDHHRMRLYAKGQAPIPPGAAILPLRINKEGKPLLQAGIGPTQGWFMLDTGGGVSIILQRQFWQRHHLAERYRPPIQTIVAHGIGGPIFGRLGRLPALTLGRLKLKDPLATYSTMTRGSLADPTRDGLIGQKILLHFNSIFDYANHRLILTPSRTFAKRDQYSRTGLAGSLEDLGYRIEAIIPGGPADQAGLKKGDIILTANGQILDEAALRTALSGPVGKRIRLEILRGDLQIQSTLTLRNVL